MSKKNEENLKYLKELFIIMELHDVILYKGNGITVEREIIVDEGDGPDDGEKEPGPIILTQLN